MNTSFTKYLLSLLLFGSNGIVASFILLGSVEIVLFRTLIGSLLLIGIFACSRTKLTFHKKKKDFLFVSLSGIALGTSWIFLFEAYNQIGVGVASLCYYCGPVIVMILAPLVFREKLTAMDLLGFLAVLLGVFLVNGQAAPGEGSRWGLVCGMMSAVMYAVMMIFSRKAKSIGGLENSMIQLFFSFLAVAVFVGVRQGFAITVPAGSIVPILILGIFNTGIGCYLYFSSIGRLPVQTVAICGYLEPLSAVLFSVCFLGEAMGPVRILGVVLILGGAVFGELHKMRPACHAVTQ